MQVFISYQVNNIKSKQILCTNFYSHAKKKKNHPSLQESLNAAKQFYFVLICLDLTKTFYQKTNLLPQMYVSRVNHNMKSL